MYAVHIATIRSTEMPTVTGGWSGLWNRVGGEQHSLLIPRDYNTSGGTQTVRGHAMARRIATIVHTRGGRTAAERMFFDLNEDVKQVTPNAQPGNPIVNGGMIPIGTYDIVPMTSANFQDAVEKNNTITTYPKDASGNGGGGKLGLKL